MYMHYAGRPSVLQLFRRLFITAFLEEQLESPSKFKIGFGKVIL